MPKIVRDNAYIDSDVDPSFYLKFTNIQVRQPTVHDHFVGVSTPATPHECRLRDLTYAGRITVNIQYRRAQQIVTKKDMEIGWLPIMLKSKRCILYNKGAAECVDLDECPLDPGGYFVINGVERIILIQEQLSKNRIIIEEDHHGVISASVHSATDVKRSKTHVMYTKSQKVVLRNNSLNADVDVVVAMRAMGIQSDREIAELVCGNTPSLLTLFTSSLMSSPNIRTQAEALYDIGIKVKVHMRSHRAPTGPGHVRTPADDARDLLADTVLAHVPVEDSGGEIRFRPKAVLLGFMARKVLMAIQKGGALDDQDYMGNKRLELSGPLLTILFEDLFKSWTTYIKRNIDANLKRKNRTSLYDPASALTQTSRIVTDGMVRALATGNWRVNRFKMDRAGVTQILTRLSYASAVGCLGRVASQFEKSRKVSGPRSLQTSSWGMLCPADTPEGESCGLIKHLALTARITNDTSADPIRHYLFILGLEDVNYVGGRDIYASNSALVFLNGVLLGIHRNPLKLAASIRALRRTGKLDPDISISVLEGDQKVVNVSSDSGRVSRPLIVVEKGEPKVTDKHFAVLNAGKLSFADLVDGGKIEYLDVNESSDSFIALTEEDIYYNPPKNPKLRRLRQNANPFPDTTHLEIAPFSILGAIAGIIPFPNHNQSPRNTYQCAMGKQATGILATNQHIRLDSLAYLLNYPQYPLVSTHTMDICHLSELPAGQNAVVAVMSYSGYDIEDAVVLGRASLDRGFGRCEVLRRFSTLIKAYADSRSVDQVVPPAVDREGRVDVAYEAIEDDGIVGVGEWIKPGGVLVNKMVPAHARRLGPSVRDVVDVESFEHVERPTKFRYPGEALVDKVLITQNHEDQINIKILVRQPRRPEIGDKFSSRHGQKGVCGIIVNQEDMPFDSDGIVPDMIMNPHGFPSRMTVGQMLELVTGKVGALEGCIGNGTAFHDPEVEVLAKLLVDNGFNYSGKDYLTSGITGEPLSAYIFIGPVFYQKLKHMVIDKMHARSRGPRTQIARQPTEGRSRDGGLRLGEMERDCLVAHGTSSILIERLMMASDATTVQVCGACGILAGAWNGVCKCCGAGEGVTVDSIDDGKKRKDKKWKGKGVRSGGRGGVVEVKVPYACKLLFQELMSMNVVPRVGVGDLE
ncbi:DNA-directed RNA polymerase III core subunit ret1 [Rhizophlyctis rosea]|nr:DNA-directed RNA polymerase III core subunit ret1 [Rhizophlyctis rosea]